MLPVIDAAGDRTMSWAALSRAGLLWKIAGAPCVRAAVHSGTVPISPCRSGLRGPSTWVYLNGNRAAVAPAVRPVLAVL